MDEARKEHIPVAVHLPKNVSSAEASNAGAANLEHIETTTRVRCGAKEQLLKLWNKPMTDQILWASSESIAETQEVLARTRAAIETTKLLLQDSHPRGSSFCRCSRFRLAQLWLRTMLCADVSGKSSGNRNIATVR
jgi:hypothetical protein